MLSFLFLFLSIAIVVGQVSLDRRTTVLTPHILFQIYFIIQLPLNLFLGTNYYLPRFTALSPLTPMSDIVWLGGLMIIAQLIFVFVVHAIGARPVTGPVAMPVTWPRTRVNLICAGIFLLGYLAFLGLVLINGGFAAFAETREAWRTEGVGGQGWVLFPATTMLAIGMCATMLNNVKQFTGRAGAVKLFVLYLIAAFPASQLGFRALIFLPLLQAGFFYHSFIRPIPGKYILIGSVALMMAFTLYGIQREIPYAANYGSYLEYLNYVYLTRPDITYTVALRSMGADIVQQTIDHMQTFSDYVLFFPIFIEALTIAVPSSLWSGKPQPLSVKFSHDIFGIEGGVSPTILGEGYWHGGILGIIALMTLAGLLHAYFRSLQRNSKMSASSALLMLSLYPSLIMMAEAFQGYFNGIILICISNWLLGLAIGAKRVPSSETAAAISHDVTPDRSATASSLTARTIVRPG